MKKQNSLFLKNSIYTFIRNIIVIILGLLSVIIIARNLGPEYQGVYSLVILIPTMLFTFFNIGISSSTVYFLGSKRYSTKEIASSNTLLAFFLSIISIVSGILFIIFFKDSMFEGISLIILLSFLSILPILFLNNFNQAIFQGLEDFKSYNIITILGKLVNLISLILFLYLFNISLIGALISFFLGHLLTAILLFVLLRRKKYVIAVKYFSINYIKDSFTYGLKAHLSNILAFFNYRVDILFLSFFTGPLAVGIYSVAVQIAERLWVISAPVSTVLFPRISASNIQEQNKLTALVTRNVLFLSIILGIVLFLFSDFLIIFLFGLEYQYASKVIKILLPGITLFSAERILSNSFAGKGMPKINLYTSIFTLLCNATLNIILIPTLGIKGAAIGTSVSYILSFLLKLIIYRYYTKTTLKELLIINKIDLYFYINLFKKLLKRG